MPEKKFMKRKNSDGNFLYWTTELITKPISSKQQYWCKITQKYQWDRTENSGLDFIHMRI